MTKRFLSLLLAGLTVPAYAAPAPALPDADPAIWVVRDPDTTVYLFGTVHALDGKRDWFNDEVKAAFDASDEVVLEIIPPEDIAALQGSIGKYMFDPSGRTLTSKLSPEGQKRLAATLTGHGLKPTALDKYKPFFASMTLTSLAFQKMGFSAEAGAEKIIKSAAAAQGKKLGALETIDYQLGLFDGLTEAEQIKLLEGSLKDGGTMPEEIAGMVASWAKGDAAKVAALLNQTDLESPTLYKVLLVDRNRIWADWIVERMKRPGTVFIAVGAGHLGGKDSVQRLLNKRNIRSSRVPSPKK